MKKYILLIYLISFVCPFSFGQVQVNGDMRTLDSSPTEKGHIKIAEKRSVTLKPGFTYKADANNTLRVFIETPITPTIRVKVINTDDNSLVDGGKYTLLYVDKWDEAWVEWGADKIKYLYQIFNRNKLLIDDISPVNGVFTIYNLEVNPNLPYFIIAEKSSPSSDYYSTFYPLRIDMKDKISEEHTLYYKKYTSAEKQAFNNGNRQALRYVSIDVGDDITEPTTYADYDAVRIGEYYWMTNNFRHEVKYKSNPTLNICNTLPTSDKNISTYLGGMRLDPNKYEGDFGLFNSSLINHYYGMYYTYNANFYGTIYNRNTGEEQNGWVIPSRNDFRQLFAMTPFHSENSNNKLGQVDVRLALSAVRGQNPLAYDFDPVIENGVLNGDYMTRWYEQNTNIYGFNMTPGGQKWHVPYTNVVEFANSPTSSWFATKGDLRQMYHTTQYLTKDLDENYLGALTIAEHLTFYNYSHANNEYNVRYCRRIPVEELGYELYYNNDETNPSIKRLGLKDPVPTGYKVLPAGYLRGFYVQYYLDGNGNLKPNPKYSILDILCFANCVDEISNGKHMNTDCKSCIPGRVRTATRDLETPILISQGIKLYPNPTQDELNIESSLTESISAIKFYDSVGRLALNVTSPNSPRVDVSGLSKGVYFVKIEAGKEIHTFRIIKQ